MARQRDDNVFPANDIHLFKDQVLGIGSYGKVCRAEYRHHPCAAKIMHETLVYPTAIGSSQLLQDRQRRPKMPFERFMQECELLSGVRHPNVIRYLCMHQDPDTDLPVLLMELMDDSLTHYLESSVGQGVLYHVQVDICNDIALALEFLHANDIIHRDLSSNNVLLRLGGMQNGVRAKVTDFGMAKLVGVDHEASSLTVCPGANVYMPPEAVQDNPVYTDKIDCFSFGVLVVQILTQQFPNPGDRHARVNPGQHCQRPMVEIIPEVERRRNHISQIDPNHLLLPIALGCLRDNDVERPPAQRICEQITVVKRSPEYIESAQRNVAVQEHVHSTLRRLQHPVQGERIVQDTLSSSRQIEHTGIVCQPEMRINWIRGSAVPCAVYRWCDAVVGNGVVYFRQAGLTNLHINYCYSTISRRWNRLPNCPLGHPTLTIIDGQLTAIGDKSPISNQLYTFHERRHDKQWTTKYPPMPTKRYLTTALCTEAALIVAGGIGEPGNHLLTTVEVMHRENQQWSTAASLPLPLTRCSVSLIGEYVYLLGGLTVNRSSLRLHSCSLRHLLESCHMQIASYRSRASVWNRLADLPVYDSTCVSLHESLLAIGGRNEGYEPTDAIHLYKPATNTWEIISHMSFPRYQCFAAVLANQQVMVVGGAVRKYPFMCTNEVEFATVSAP